MAYISVKSKTSDSAKLCLLSLDTNWTSGTRTVAWYLGFPNSSRPTETSFYRFKQGADIENKASSGGDAEFGDLEPDTRYYVYCQVYHGSSMLADFEGEFRTDSASVTQPWSLDCYAQTDVDEYGTSIYGEFSSYSVAQYPIQFSGNGEIWINFGGDTNTVVYISTSDDIDYETGEPLSYEAVSYNGSISQFWVSDAETYYIYVRSDTGTESGSFWIDISPPWVTALGGSTKYIDKQGTSYTKGVSQLTIYRNPLVFLESGTVKISLSEDSFVNCWIGTSTDYGAGAPLEYDVFIDSFDSTPVEYNVTKGVKYYIWFTSAYSGYYTEATLNISYAEGTVTISKWSWNASNGSASATETIAAHSAIVNKSATTNFSHLVWEDMVDKVWEIIKAKTNWWDENYASLSDTKYLPQNSDGKYELTAVAFNSLRNNIELIGNRSDVLGRKTGIGVVYAKDTDFPVKAGYFTTLTDYINDCIDNL